jgi:hypothetical protein
MNATSISRIGQAGAAAIIVAACLYVPLGSCGTALCNYEGHGWLFVNYALRFDYPPRVKPFVPTADNPFDFRTDNPEPDRRTMLIRDRLLAQVAASMAAAGLLLAVSRTKHAD